jgi:hypothetical protein
LSTNNEIENRVAILERENRALKVRLDAMASTKPAPPRPPESSVKITHPVSKVSLPSAGEARQLCDAVWRHYPKLRPSRNEEEEFFGQFSAAFQFVAHHGRRAVDRERSLGWWLDTAREWISQHRIGGFPISGTALVVAIIAAGDVPFSDPGEPGFVVGLQWGGGGVPERGWWKRVLGGALLDPTPPLHPMPAPSPARVRHG